MMILVIGGSGSGKSAYAERIAAELSKGEDSFEKISDGKTFAEKTPAEEKIQKYYLATMRIWDEEGQKKVERHRMLRKDRGFLTIEQPVAVEMALVEMKAQRRLILLECISNLTANEMFSEAEPKTAAQTAEIVIKGVARLKEQTTHCIVVSSNVFEDGMSYDETTAEYIRAMGEINRKLAAMAEQAVEVVAGIPVMLKQERGGA